jgi:hypothetical protein
VKHTGGTVFSYILGAITGAAFGSMVGYIKYATLWKRIIKDNKKISTGALYQHLGVSYAINIATLLFVFLMRNIMPFDFVIVMIATAVMLSLIGKLAPMSEIMNHVEEKAS